MSNRFLKILIASVVFGVSVAEVAGQKKTSSTAKNKKTTSMAKPPAAHGNPGVVASKSSSSPGNVGANAGLKLLSAKERETIEAINLARAKPAEFLKLLQDFRKYYRGKEIHFPDGRILVTNEGVAALDDAINFVRTVKPLPPYELREGLVGAAKLHVTDMVKSNRSGHQGSDGSKPTDRISRFGMWENSVGENIVYDSRGAKTDVILMAIDDGTSNRGHRRNIFKNDFRVIGIAMDQRPRAELVGVITFAGGFIEKRSTK